MPHTRLTRTSRLSEIEDRLAKRYESKGTTAQEARRQAKEKIEERSGGIVGVAYGKGFGVKRSASRDRGQSRAMEVKNRSDKEKKQSAMRKTSHQKSPGQKRIRGDAGKMQT